MYKAGFSPSQRAHIVQRASVFINENTIGADWQVQEDAFLAWGTPQQFTIPLYAYFNPTTFDYVYIASGNGAPPSPAGFSLVGPVAYVYGSQECGSVPLFVVFQDVAGDHFLTTSTAQRDELIALGWIDSGVVAFVLPLATW